MWDFASCGRWTEKWNYPWLVTNNEANKVKAASQCLQMKKNMTRAPGHSEVTQKEQGDSSARARLASPVTSTRTSLTASHYGSDSQSTSSRFVQKNLFLSCLQIVIPLSEMHTELVCILANASPSSIKDIIRYGHAGRMKYPCPCKQGHNEVPGWHGARTASQANADVSWVFAPLAWFTWAACHILSWWPLLS